MRRLFSIVLVSVGLVLPSVAATVDGLRIHSAGTGHGRSTVIFVHGWTCDSSSWTAQVAELSKTYRVVTLDLPGHGRSESPPAGKFSIDLFARAIEAVRDEQKADKVVLVGHSLGAPVIRHYTQLYPQHVAGLVAADGPLVMTPTPGRPTGPPAWTLVQMTGPDGRKAREDRIRQMFTPQTPLVLQQKIFTMMLKPPETTAAGALAVIRAEYDPTTWKYDVITVPALAIYAGTAAPPNMQEIQKIVPNFKATKIAGTGHFVMMENPKEFNRLLKEFLRSIEF